MTKGFALWVLAVSGGRDSRVKQIPSSRCFLEWQGVWTQVLGRIIEFRKFRGEWDPSAREEKRGRSGWQFSEVSSDGAGEAHRR